MKQYLSHPQAAFERQANDRKHLMRKKWVKIAQEADGTEIRKFVILLFGVGEGAGF